MALTESERDNLLVRLDERTRNIWRSVEQIEIHAAEQNGYIAQNFTRSTVNSRMIKVVSSIGGTGLVALFTKIFGWW